MDIMVKTYICKYCGHEFTNISKGKFSAHVRLCDKNPNAQKLRDALSRGGTNKCKKYNVLSALPKKIYNCTCENCGKTFIVNCSENEFSRKKHWFCSRSCANTRTFDNSIKQKISETLYTTLAKKKHVSPEIWTKLKFCADCGTQLGKRNKSGYCKQCAPHHLSKETLLRIRRGALKSVQVQSITRRSKNEMAFCDLCERHFNHVLHNVPMFNGWDADVILLDYKIAILWNGRWHYEQLSKKQSVKAVQNRDRIKLKEIASAGYEPYVICDMGKFNEAKVTDEFNKLVKFINTKMNKNSMVE